MNQQAKMTKRQGVPRIEQHSAHEHGENAEAGSDEFHAAENDVILGFQQFHETVEKNGYDRIAFFRRLVDVFYAGIDFVVHVPLLMLIW